MDVAHFSNLEYGFQFNNSYSDHLCITVRPKFYIFVVSFCRRQATTQYYSRIHLTRRGIRPHCPSLRDMSSRAGMTARNDHMIQTHQLFVCENFREQAVNTSEQAALKTSHLTGLLLEYDFTLVILSQFRVIPCQINK